MTAMPMISPPTTKEGLLHQRGTFNIGQRYRVWCVCGWKWEGEGKAAAARAWAEHAGTSVGDDYW